MKSERHDYGLVIRLEADAVGLPGQRRFRLLALGAKGLAVLWLEKEQFQALGMAIDQMLGEMPPMWSLDRVGEAKPPRAIIPFSKPSVELEAGQLGLGFDEERRQYVLQAHDAESDADGPPTFTCLASKPQLEALSRQITDVVSAGRPRCPLCHAPLGDEPHSCPGHNGHH